MALSSVAFSSLLIFLAALSTGASLTNAELCHSYENRTEYIGKPKGLYSFAMEYALFLELRNCKLEALPEKFPSRADFVTLINVTVGAQVTWKDVVPLNISNELLIKDSTFEDEAVLRSLPVSNIGLLSILNSGLSVLPSFSVAQECLTRKANFSGNAITAVTEEAFRVLYSSCKFLEDLDLTHNNIRKFPKFATQNVSKCKLHLENNPLSCTENDHLTLNQRTRDMLIRTPHCERNGELVPFWFHDSPICAKCHCYIHSDIYVNCSHRGLTSLPAGLPRETTHLDVSGNELTSLHVPANSPWKGYNSVKYLNASWNPIARIDDYAPHICNLMILDVSHARLEMLSASLVNALLNGTSCVPLLSVGRLLLGNNPWRCNCDLLPFRRLLGERSKEIVDFFTVQCDGDGEEIWKLQQECFCPPPIYELNVWDVSIVVISTLITFMIYKTIRDYYQQKHTGKLPKFFKF